MKSKKHTRQPNQQLTQRVRRILPPLQPPENCNLMPNESSVEFYSRMEPFRRKCEARAVLLWLVEGKDIEKYFSEVSQKRNRRALTTLRQDMYCLYQDISKADSSLELILKERLAPLGIFDVADGATGNS